VILRQGSTNAIGTVAIGSSNSARPRSESTTRHGLLRFTIYQAKPFAIWFECGTNNCQETLNRRGTAALENCTIGSNRTAMGTGPYWLDGGLYVALGYEAGKFLSYETNTVNIEHSARR
jgi:hypothetical protein